MDINNLMNSLFDGDMMNKMMEDIQKVQEDTLKKLKEQTYCIATSTCGYNIKITMNSFKEVVDIKVNKKEIEDINLFLKALQNALNNAYEEVEYKTKKMNEENIKDFNIDDLTKNIFG